MDCGFKTDGLIGNLILLSGATMIDLRSDLDTSATYFLSFTERVKYIEICRELACS